MWMCGKTVELYCGKSTLTKDCKSFNKPFSNQVITLFYQKEIKGK